MIWQATTKEERREEYLLVTLATVEFYHFWGLFYANILQWFYMPPLDPLCPPLDPYAYLLPIYCLICPHLISDIVKRVSEQLLKWTISDGSQQLSEFVTINDSSLLSFRALSSNRTNSFISSAIENGLKQLIRTSTISTHSSASN